MPCICGQCGPTSGKTIKLGGSKTSTLYLSNPDRRTAWRHVVDGCQITAGPRCDWLVCVHDAHGTEEIFVELKGADVPKAVAQLEATIQRLRCEPRRDQPRCIVASTRNPLAGTDVALLKSRFKDRYGARLETLRDGATAKLRR